MVVLGLMILASGWRCKGRKCRRFASARAHDLARLVLYG